MNLKEQAAGLLREFKGDSYVFGLGCLDAVGDIAARHGKKALLIGNTTYLKNVMDGITASLAHHGVSLAGDRIVPDAAPNAPREDVYRIESYIHHFSPDCVIVVGGGSSIDAAKAANMLAVLGPATPEIDAYFGTGLATEALKRSGSHLRPLIAVQTAASSGAHLTKYSNITDPVAGQKKLIVDEAIVPHNAVFDYSVTASMPLSLTIDGALDGLAHCLEVYYGAAPERLDAVERIALPGIELVLQFAPQVLADPGNGESREGLGLATDLGGYAIMVGGTNGAHLTSFSLVDITSHGRACGIMNPYYTVFFAPAVERQLQKVGEIFHRYGFVRSLEGLHGRSLGIAVAEGMVAFARSIGAPTRLTDIPGFTEGHLARALAAAKDPQLEMKLRNMPVPLTAASVDEFMGPILRAAASGDFTLIKNWA